MTVEQVLFALLREEICGEPVSQEVKEALSSEMLEDLFELSHKHDLAHLVGQALSNLDVLGEDETSEKFRKTTMDAVSRFILKNYEYQRICKIFEDARIPFMPLKGSIIRDWYPEPWMRTSSDIDILVNQGDEDRSAELVVQQLGYRKMQKSSRDISLYSPAGVHLELHYVLLEDAISKEDEITRKFWETATLAKGFSFRYEMLPAMFRFFHIIHMSNHIKNGGCGIRFFLDLWLIDRNLEWDEETEQALLRRSRLTTFAGVVEKLSRVWFGNEEPDSLTDALAEYVLTGGIYGNLKNQAAIRHAKKGNKLLVLYSRIFVSYDRLKYYYPVLQKHKWLYPFCQIRRWCRLVFTEDMHHSANELKATVENSEEDSISVMSFLSSLELM